MNLAPLLDACVSLAGVVISAAVPILVVKGLSLLHVNVSAAQEQSLDNTLENALGEALKYGQAAGDSALSNVTIKNAALSQALTFAMNDAPTEIKALGYSPAEIGQLIANRLATALHESTPPAPALDVAKTAAMLDKAEVAVAVPVEPAPAPVAA